MKTRIFTWMITAGAFLDTILAVINDNSGVLAELGVSPKITKVIMLLGLLWTAFSKSLTEKGDVSLVDLGGSNPPADKDEK